MDDLKLFAANNNQLASVIKIVNKFSSDIGMSFGIEKYKKSHHSTWKNCSNGKHPTR